MCKFKHIGCVVSTVKALLHVPTLDDIYTGPKITTPIHLRAQLTTRAYAKQLQIIFAFK